MIWILEMVVVLIVAHYTIRGIDRAWNRRKQRPTVGQLVEHRRRKKARSTPDQWWSPNTSSEGLKFPEQPNKSAG